MIYYEKLSCEVLRNDDNRGCFRDFHGVKTYGRYRLVLVVDYRADLDTIFNCGYPGYSLLLFIRKIQ